MKRFFMSLAGVLVLLLGVLVFNTVRFSVPATTASPTYAITVTPNGEQLAQQLSQAIQFQTLSRENGNTDNYAAFSDFTAWLEQTYPQVFASVTVNRLNQHTLLLHWQGTANSAPVLFSAHYDVVPVNPGTEQDWQYPPFAGTIVDGMIWGRGALDDKGSVVALMASVSALLKQDFTPTNDIYIALTHDEELGSELGAQSVLAYFKQHNITPAWSLDEGSFVLRGIAPGVEKDIASINVTEKGFLNVKLTATAAGGHSSMPPEDTAVTLLANALVKLHNAPLPGSLEGVSKQMYSNIARHMDFPKRFLFANMWLFKPLLNSFLAGSPSGNAMLRTTTAPTMLSGSVKANVLPASATATVNFRLHPRDTINDVLTHVTNAIDDNRIKVEALESFEAANVAPSDTQGFTDLADAAEAIYADTIITPGITIAATDSRFYSQITHSYRFTPMVVTMSDVDTIHGTNEKVSIQNMVNAVRFYTAVMQRQ
ncbi:M20 family peptidase [Alteromonas sp. C1M14]|uniref:M20 family peptidase n=1 Tax=Alteromonas sp. C1M14 TaxID=2841567 RepID=UPI001C0926CB|nr:M20 family peptidase [Alteromonas sp. C1M14]MBU2979931.1 M20 family peptidase [Alteromonas sp. C1M14]